MKGNKFCLVMLMLLLTVFVRNAYADEPFSEATHPGNWTTKANINYGPANFVISPFIQAPDSEKYKEDENAVSKETIKCRIAATPLGAKHNRFGFAEMVWQGSKIEYFSTYCQMTYKYRIEVSEGTVHSPVMHFSDTTAWRSSSYRPPSQTWLADGKWHTMTQPLDIFAADFGWPANGGLSNVLQFALNFDLSVPNVGDQITVTVYLSDFQFVKTADAQPAYLVVYDDQVSRYRWETTAPDPTLADIIEKPVAEGGWGFSGHHASYNSLTPELLSHFKLVVFEPSSLHSDNATNDMLLDYVAGGGGLLIMGTWNWTGQDNENNSKYNTLLQKLGIQILSEQVFDNDTDHQASCQYNPVAPVAWTSNFSTELAPDDTALQVLVGLISGENRIYYSTKDGKGWTDYTSPLYFTQTDTPWKVLMSGMDSSLFQDHS